MLWLRLAQVYCERDGANAVQRGRPEDVPTPPFQVWMYPQARFLADLHAHLCHHEVIGMLGGRWDSEAKVLHIMLAMPARAIEIDDDANVNVEMDPMSQHEATSRIEQHGLTVVGWYHSHPVFQPDPSVRDIENQSKYVEAPARAWSACVCCGAAALDADAPSHVLHFGDYSMQTFFKSSTGSVAEAPFVGVIVSP